MKKIIENNKISFWENDKEVAHITFPKIRQDLVDINHTYVGSDYRGKGLADKLMLETVAVIEKNDWHCICTCSYAEHWFMKHPEKKELLK